MLEQFGQSPVNLIVFPFFDNLKIVGQLQTFGWPSESRARTARAKKNPQVYLQQCPKKKPLKPPCKVTLKLSIHPVALWTRNTSQIWKCVKYVPQYTFRNTLNRGYITGLGMCKVCIQAVHSVALWTRVTLQVWKCVKYVPQYTFRNTLNRGYIAGFDMCKVCIQAVHSVALWTRVTLQVWTCQCVKYVPKQSIP